VTYVKKDNHSKKDNCSKKAKLLLQFWLACCLVVVVLFFFIVPIQTEGINIMKSDVGIKPDILCFCVKTCQASAKNVS